MSKRTRINPFSPIIHRGKAKPQGVTPDVLINRLFRHMSSDEVKKWAGDKLDDDPVWQEIAAALYAWSVSVWQTLGLALNEKQEQDWNKLLWLLITIAQYTFALGIKIGYNRKEMKGNAN